VVVTGAAAGLGRATALGLAGAGAAVVAWDRDADGLQRLVADAPSVRASVLDVRDSDAVAAAAAEVLEADGRIGGLVNNAGGTFRADFVDLTDRGVAALVAENFTSVVEVTRALLPGLVAGRGAVVNVTSSEAHQAAPGFSVYAAMKAAVENLTRTLALELAEHGVRVNSVAPDGIPTAGDAALVEATRASAFVPPPVPPLGRFGDPGELASVVLFLLSEASSFVTGACVHVDGGLHAAGGWHRRTDPPTG
jgi:3-oxoacyl-[acyl-carrier protein] reductase